MMSGKTKSAIAVLLTVLSVLSLCACSKQSEPVKDDYEILAEQLESELEQMTVDNSDDNDKNNVANTDRDDDDTDDEPDYSSDILPEFDKSGSFGAGGKKYPYRRDDHFMP